VEDDHDLVRFYLPEAARWGRLAKLTTGLGEALTDAVRAVSRENPRLAGVIDVVGFNATQGGQRKRAMTGCGNWCSTDRRSRGALRCAWTRESLSPPQGLRWQIDRDQSLKAWR